jgi:hypothetical protein
MVISGSGPPVAGGADPIETRAAIKRRRLAGSIFTLIDTSAVGVYIEI